ncbi:unnamed protein product [Wickerhamomyces anomalus]
MSQVTNTPQPPYTPVNKPVVQYIEYNGANFYTELWSVPKDTELKGRIVWVHGFSEFSKVYVQLFDDLSHSGYEVFFFDQRGAGLTSPGKLKGITDDFHAFDDLDFFLKKNIDELRLVRTKKSSNAATNIIQPSTRPGRVLYGISYSAMKLIPNYRMDTKLKEEYITSVPEWRKFLSNEPVTPLLGSLKNIYEFLKR